MKTCVLVLLAILAISALALPGYAQYGDELHEYPSRWDIRVGVAFPNADTDDTSEVIVGVEYEHPMPSWRGYLTLTADYTAISSPVAGDDVTLLPFLVNFKRESTAEDIPVYFGFGLGFYWAEDPIPEMRLDDGASFAWQLMAGMEWNTGFFLEGRYIAGNNPSDDGLGIVNVGFRF